MLGKKICDQMCCSSGSQSPQKVIVLQLFILVPSIPFPTHRLNCLLTVPDISLGYSEEALPGGNCRAACAGFLAEISSNAGEEEARQGARDGQLSTQLCHISAALLAAVRGKGCQLGKKYCSECETLNALILTVGSERAKIPEPEAMI